MKTHLNFVLLLVLGLALVTLTAPGTMAADKITLEDGQLTIESGDGDQVMVLNAEGMQDIFSDLLEESLDGMDVVMSELDEMQLEIRLGDDNQLSIETEDQLWEMNLDLIFHEIGSALETALDEIETDGWTNHQRWDADEDRDDISEEELSEELDRLKDELRKLKKEMRTLKEL